MADESMSAQRQHNGFRALRPEYLDVTDGNACAALLLDLFAYWTQVRASNDEQSRAGGGEGNDLWFYRSLTDLHDDLYGAFGRAAIRTALQVLADKDLVESRANPSKPWDRTLQYRIDDRDRTLWWRIDHDVLNGITPSQNASEAGSSGLGRS